jgi:Protein of unknown function (DUF3551)
MRMPALAILMTATVSMVTPTWAQTYSPDYPVCLQAYHLGGGDIDCSFVSLAQCAQTASGLSAECLVNPYFASAQRPAGPNHRRHHRAY